MGPSGGFLFLNLFTRDQLFSVMSAKKNKKIGLKPRLLIICYTGYGPYHMVDRNTFIVIQCIFLRNTKGILTKKKNNKYAFQDIMLHFIIIWECFLC